MYRQDRAKRTGQTGEAKTYHIVTLAATFDDLRSHVFDGAAEGISSCVLRNKSHQLWFNCFITAQLGAALFADWNQLYIYRNQQRSMRHVADSSRFLCKPRRKWDEGHERQLIQHKVSLSIGILVALFLPFFSQQLGRVVSILYLFVRQEFLAEAEIRQNDVSLRVEQDIFQFDVTVDDTQLQNRAHNPMNEKEK